MSILAGKVAIVTGSSRGIGAHIAKTLARAGAKVVVNYLNDQIAAERVVADIRAEGADALAVCANVGNVADVSGLFDAGIARFGKVDILINNAGIAIYKRIQETSETNFDRVFNVNVKGVFLTLREAATRLASNGRIVNVSSSVTRLMMVAYGPYSASKAAVEQLTRVFAQEVGPRGITVNSVSPGPVNTELFAQGRSEQVVQRLAEMAALQRIGELDDVARVVLFLVSDQAAWVSAQNVGVNGGFA